ncbi:hypothetical protein HMPREF0988_02676 [Lachnospiraceae bacterium 1_4_56FAA]|nr:hypothetical protein HMPREF0988_02676 [Lachnospiraceae bacterium 1_4_56FAA]
MIAAKEKDAFKKAGEKKEDKFSRSSTVRRWGSAAVCVFYRNICRGTTAGTLLVFVFFCLVTAASVSDLKCRKISDRLCGLILGIAVAAVFFMPGVTPLERILSAAAIGSLMLTATLILPGVFGGGDIKLMAACGGFLGWEMIRDAFVTAVIAAALAVFLLRVKEREYRTGIAMAPFFELGMVLHFLRN